MRKFAVVFAFVLGFGSVALAQIQQRPFELPKTEFFLGYAYEHADLSGSFAGTLDSVSESSTGLNGFAFEASHFLTSKIGLTVDIARTSNSRVDASGIKYVRSSYMAGPSYRLPHNEFFSPSIHVLAGVDHGVFTVPENLPSTFTFGNTEFAAAAGATVDGSLSRRVALRLAQVDYVYSHHYGSNQSSFRYSGGLVVRF